MKLLPLLLLAGCAIDQSDDLSLSETDQAVKAQPGDCQTYNCGGNSSGLDGKLVTELHELGKITPEGFQLIDFGRYEPNWRSMRPDVLDSELLARDRNTGAIRMKGGELVGTIFIVQDTETRELYYITVVRAERTSMWSQFPTAGKKSWNYELSYTSSSKPKERHNVCMKPPSADPMDPQMTVLFDNDRIVHDDIRFNPEEDDWFTFGCSGSALAKQHLSGHTKAGSKIMGVTTTLNERTAYLKMMTADYCGKGHTYTVTGVPLHYASANKLMSTVKSGEKVEAIWTERGAICAGTPRVEYNPTQESIAHFGTDLDDDLTKFECTLPPPCTPDTYQDKFGYAQGLVMSTNP